VRFTDHPDRYRLAVSHRYRLGKRESLNRVPNGVAKIEQLSLASLKGVSRRDRRLYPNRSLD
jgi:hypothetical protein